MRYPLTVTTYFLSLFIAYAQKDIIPLYPEGVRCGNDLPAVTEYDGTGRIFRKVVNPEIWYYPTSIKKRNKTAVLVIPGGGYQGLWFDHEGVKVANWLNRLGITAFVLKHRVPHWESEDCRSKVALSDAQRAMRIIRSNSKKWDVNPNKIGVLGFSAGGPQNAWNVLQGIETLSVRMQKHCSNAEKMVEYLSGHESVAWVSHPSVPDHPDHELAKKLLPNGRGSMIAFGIKGGKEAGEAFINNVKLASHLANVGDTRTLVIHPASATHSQMDEATLKFAGLSHDMIRLSVGIEDIDDIKNDFEAGFRAARKPRLVSNQ